MKSPAHALSLFLSDQGIGTFGSDAGWSINVGGEPDAPDDTVTLYDTPGRDPLLYGDTKTGDGSVYRPGIQVRVRSASYEDAYDKHESIRTLLHTQVGTTIDGARYTGIWAAGDIESIGRDDRDRYRLVANYRITRSSAVA